MTGYKDLECFNVSMFINPDNVASTGLVRVKESFRKSVKKRIIGVIRLRFTSAQL